MKKLLLLLSIVGLAFAACERVEEDPAAGLTIDLSPESIDVAFEEGTHGVLVTSPTAWSATTNDEWIVITTESGVAGTEELAFTVKLNDVKEERRGIITIQSSAYKSLVTELEVVQKAFVPYITVNPRTLTFATEGGTQSVIVNSNYAYEATVEANWISVEKNEQGVTISVDPYYMLEKRTANVELVSGTYNVATVIMVEQTGLPSDSDNIIYYTSADKKVVEPNNSYQFGKNLVSNTYDAAGDRGAITFDGNVSMIGDEAFKGCTQLKSIVIPESVTLVGNNAFSGCSSLESIELAEGITKIGWSAFYNCKELKAINIPNGVAELGYSAFENCEKLAEVELPESVKSIGENAFSGCKSLPAEDGLQYADTYLAKACENKSSYTIKEGTIFIGTYAFNKCSALTEITIPSSVVLVDDFAFGGCYSMKSITLGNNVAKIGDSAFYDCTALESVTLGESVTSIGEYAFHSCSKLTSVTIPQSVTEVGSSLFYGCYSMEAFYGKYASNDNRCLVVDGVLNSFAQAGLTEYSIPQGISEISASAFMDCDALTNVTIPDSVTLIGVNAFTNCVALRSIVIPDSVKTIATAAFLNCHSLESATIGKGVTLIETEAFHNCKALKSVECKAQTPPTANGNMFDYYDGKNQVAIGCKIAVPAASVSAYKSAAYWSKYAEYIVAAAE